MTTNRFTTPGTPTAIDTLKRYGERAWRRTRIIGIFLAGELRYQAMIWFWVGMTFLMLAGIALSLETILK